MNTVLQLLLVTKNFNTSHTDGDITGYFSIYMQITIMQNDSNQRRENRKPFKKSDQCCILKYLPQKRQLTSNKGGSLAFDDDGATETGFH